MGRYEHESDEDLMKWSEYDVDAEEELSSRGIHKVGGAWVTDADFAFDIGILLFKVALVIALLIGTHFVVAYSMDYQLYIYIGFPITFLLMFLGRGTSEFLNIIFWIGCWALATRCFPLVFYMIEGADYVDYFYHGPGLWEWIKYGFIYAAYATIVPYLVMKIVTYIVSAYREEDKSVNAS